MADLSAAPSWYTAWYADVHSRGGVVTRLPPQFASLTVGAGALCGRFPMANGTNVYEPAPIFVRLYDDANTINDALLDSTLGQVVVALGDTVNDDNNMGDLGSSVQAAGEAVVKGAKSVASLVPWWVWLAGGVVAYGALVNVGLLPGLHRLVRGE